MALRARVAKPGNGGGFKLRSCRGPWVQIPPLASSGTIPVMRKTALGAFFPRKMQQYLSSDNNSSVGTSSLQTRIRKPTVLARRQNKRNEHHPRINAIDSLGLSSTDVQHDHEEHPDDINEVPVHRGRTDREMSFRRVLAVQSTDENNPEEHNPEHDVQAVKTS